MKRLLLALGGVASAIGQNTNIVDNNANAWFNYFGDHPLGKSRFDLHLEGQWRRFDLGAKWQQLLLRPAVNYRLTPKIVLTGGYCFVETYRYGSYPVLAAFPEHRFFEQATMTQKFLGLNWLNRLRLEQRNIGQMARDPSGGFRVDSWRYENRFRYMLRTDIPLGKSKHYLALYDEIMVNWGKNVAFNTFDQNRAYIAVGRRLPKQSRVEFGFMEQTLQQRNGRIFEHNHTLQVAIYSRLPFGH
jgi:hypothetical protein